MGTPIKLEGSSGDLKQMTTTEEQYLAYRAGLRLAASTTDCATLSTSSSGATAIGSYTNTFFNQAVGTHPGSSITSGSTTTTVYQVLLAASESGTDFHRPIHWNTDKFEEMDDTELNALCDRLIGIMFANSYPGIYYLGSSSPGADYDTHIAGVFADTRADGTNVSYNIYQRQTMTAPTTVKSVKVLNDDSSFDGLKEMSDAEIEYTLGQRVKTRIMNGTDNVGAYQLRSSAQGVPSASGTWVAKGTATDTKQNTADVAYAGTYSATYTGNFVGNYTGAYSGAYTRTRVTDYTQNFFNPNAINYTRSRVNTRYSGGPQINYYVANFLGGATYTGNFVGNFVGNYTGTYSGTYSRTRATAYLGNFVGNFVGNYTGTYSGTYSRTRATGFLGNYVGNYSGLTIQSSSSTIETYTLYVRTA